MTDVLWWLAQTTAIADAQQRVKPTPSFTYLTDFNVVPSEYGSDLKKDLFEIPIPDKAEKP